MSATSLDGLHRVFVKWLGGEYDLDAVDAVVSTIAAERLGGDPLWLLLLSGSGNAKTETVSAAMGAGALVTSSITSEGALLSGTPAREKTKDATGGLLRRIGDSGVMVIKDVTTVLSMHRDTRATVLAALREIHDGRWERNIGSNGGRTLTWTGRIAVIGAVTTKWDTHHEVIASMGDRFVILRMDSTLGRIAAGQRAMLNTGAETTMRTELADAVGQVITTVDPDDDFALTDDERDRLLSAANIVTLCRTAVEYDYRGDIIDAHAPEMPTRFAKQLVQMMRGALAIGMDRTRALRLAIRCARDSMPPLRLAIIDDVAANPGTRTTDVRQRLDKPRNTVDRQLQALHMIGVLNCDEVGTGDEDKKRVVWRYSVASGIDMTALAVPVVPEKSLHGMLEIREETNERILTTDISGTAHEIDWASDLFVDTRDGHEDTLGN